MNNTYYISWHTWQERETITPWDWYPLKRGDIYRRREHSTSGLQVDSKLVASAFEAGNQTLLQTIEKEFIENLLLCAFVESESELAAKAEVQKYFPDAEIEKCSRADVETKQKILSLFSQALNKARPE